MRLCYFSESVEKNKMQKLLAKIIQIGVNPDLPLHEQERISKLNKLYLLSIPACIMGAAWSFDSLWFATITMTIAVLMQVAILFHHWGWYQTANIYTNIMFNVFCTIIAIGFNGKTGTENYHFVAIFTIQLQFHLQKIRWRIILSIMVFLSFVLVKVINWFDHPHFPIPQFWYVINVQNIVTIFFLLMFIMHEYITLIEHYQAKIELQNKVLAEKQSELIATNQVKDQLFAIIGHDLNKPLASIKGMIMLLTQKLLTPEQEIKYLNQLTGLLDSTDLTLKNLLDWGLQQNKKSQKENICVYREVLQNIDLLQTIATQKNITLINQTSPDLCVYADKNQLSFILRNLIANAVKFTEIGGTIRVYTSLLDDKYCNISIEDNGVGIKESSLSKLFSLEKRFTTKGTAKESGTGLGLPLCKQFVENNGGKLSIVSEEGKGSTFSFTMPLAETPILSK